MHQHADTHGLIQNTHNSIQELTMFCFEGILPKRELIAILLCSQVALVFCLCCSCLCHSCLCLRPIAVCNRCRRWMQNAVCLPPELNAALTLSAPKSSHAPLMRMKWNPIRCLRLLKNQPLRVTMVCMSFSLPKNMPPKPLTLSTTLCLLTVLPLPTARHCKDRSPNHLPLGLEKTGRIAKHTRIGLLFRTFFQMKAFAEQLPNHVAPNVLHRRSSPPALKRPNNNSNVNLNHNPSPPILLRLRVHRSLAILKPAAVRPIPHDPVTTGLAVRCSLARVTQAQSCRRQ